ncbi:HalOD1 output domain-containing protein [Halomicrococcus sp. NG-SE-24]|uniref:HalOD1 output domain-containing protein n=1 Tax=Halomicrococcus sp. NG-SE-24 TaxID=3436928 RepID=UPI003D961955
MNSELSNDSQDVPLEIAIITHVVAQKNVDPTKLEPLHDVIDPDALKRLFAPQFDGTPRTTGQVVFTYSGYRVTVTSDGDIQAIPLDE